MFDRFRVRVGGGQHVERVGSSSGVIVLEHKTVFTFEYFALTLSPLAGPAAVGGYGHCPALESLVSLEVQAREHIAVLLSLRDTNHVGLEHGRQVVKDALNAVEIPNPVALAIRS